MTIWAIIPVRPLEEGKSRLADILTPSERQRLNESFFRQTIAVTESVVGKARILVVSRSDTLLQAARDSGLATLAEAAPFGLNQALTQAARVVREDGATLALSISCDLPFLIPDDLRALLSAALDTGGLAIASDRRGTGTNALALSPVGAIPYRYGESSFSLHETAAATAGRTLTVVRRAGLSFDIDTPDDFEQMEEIRRETGPVLQRLRG
jgi:2-phospho-L-lactate guanylyltransferase